MFPYILRTIGKIWRHFFVQESYLWISFNLNLFHCKDPFSISLPGENGSTKLFTLFRDSSWISQLWKPECAVWGIFQQCLYGSYSPFIIIRYFIALCPTSYHLVNIELPSEKQFCEGGRWTASQLTYSALLLSIPFLDVLKYFRVFGNQKITLHKTNMLSIISKPHKFSQFCTVQRWKAFWRNAIYLFSNFVL